MNVTVHRTWARKIGLERGALIKLALWVYHIMEHVELTHTALSYYLQFSFLHFWSWIFGPMVLPSEIHVCSLTGVTRA